MYTPPLTPHCKVLLHTYRAPRTRHSPPRLLVLVTPDAGNEPKVLPDDAPRANIGFFVEVDFRPLTILGWVAISPACIHSTGAKSDGLLAPATTTASSESVPGLNHRRRGFPNSACENEEISLAHPRNISPSWTSIGAPLGAPPDKKSCQGIWRRYVGIPELVQCPVASIALVSVEEGYTGGGRSLTPWSVFAKVFARYLEISLEGRFSAPEFEASRRV